MTSVDNTNAKEYYWMDGVPDYVQYVQVCLCRIVYRYTVCKMGQMPERLGNRAIIQKIAGSIPIRQGTDWTLLALEGMSLYCTVL